ncbi:MAG: hypothetical protein R2788_19955 [Saprospiraceae bacterium]
MASISQVQVILKLQEAWFPIIPLPAEGGGLWNGTGTMTISGVVINANTASGADADQGGGGVFNAGGTVGVIDNTMITNNICDGAAGSGGGIFNDAGGSLTVMNSTISGNTAVRA